MVSQAGGAWVPEDSHSSGNIPFGHFKSQKQKLNYMKNKNKLSRREAPDVCVFVVAALLTCPRDSARTSWVPPAATWLRLSSLRLSVRICPLCLITESFKKN